MKTKLLLLAYLLFTTLCAFTCIIALLLEPLVLSLPVLVLMGSWFTGVYTEVDDFILDYLNFPAAENGRTHFKNWQEFDTYLEEIRKR